jgi:ferrous iron transport protein B
VIYGSRPHDTEVLRRMRLAHERESNYRAGIYDKTAHDKREMKIALAGNPNSGKTTLFNVLTGSNQYVGNWPGVTVEKKEGRAQIQGRSVTIVDLPGIYSLSPYSMEEDSGQELHHQRGADAIINIVDATNLERNLYLTIQLLELERPMVLALNFMDEIEKNGDKIDTVKLSAKLGIPVIPITAKTGKNLEELMNAAHMQMHIGYTIERTTSTTSSPMRYTTAYMSSSI